MTAAAELKGRHVLVLGLGRSGTAACRGLSKLGAHVLALEQDEGPDSRRRAAELAALGVDVRLGPHSASAVNGCELAIVSPGIPPSTPIIGEIGRRMPIWSEIELAARLLTGNVIAVTGTNGKTTTVSLIGEILKRAGRECIVAGNIGYPLIEAVMDSGPNTTAVVEVSSFQLEYTHSLRPGTAVLLNVTADHLDWHPDFDAYLRAKYRLFELQGPDDFAVLNADDRLCAEAPTAARRVAFSARRQVSGMWSDGRAVFWRDEPRPLLRCDEFAMPGEHNLENAMAAGAAAIIQGVEPAAVAAGWRDFRGVEHRLEPVADEDGITFINDSKATNPEAAIRGVRAFSRPIVLLAGGRNKGNSFDRLAEEARGRVKTAVVFGESAADLEKAFSRLGIDTRRAGGLEAAVAAARAAASPGDVVLLSPACASYDMFANFEERGRAFKAAVGAGGGA